MIEYGSDCNHSDPGGKAASVFSLILPEFFAPMVKKAQKYSMMQILEIVSVERYLLGHQCVLNTFVHQV
jgi:hypothetical protein